MLGWRSSGFRPTPSAGSGADRAVERRLEEHEQRGEERAEAEQHGGRVRRDLAQPVPGEEQDQARPQRQQQQPQQQRALLRGPHRGRAVEERRRGRGVVGDEREREVRAQERDLEDHERDRRGAGQRVDRAAAGGDPLAPARARAVERRADAVEADGERDDQAGLARDAARQVSVSAVNFDGHFVTSESFWPTKTSPCLRTSTMTSRSARNGSGSDPLVADGHRRLAVAVADPEVGDGARRARSPPRPCR